MSTRQTLTQIPTRQHNVINTSTPPQMATRHSKCQHVRQHDVFNTSTSTRRQRDVNTTSTRCQHDVNTMSTRHQHINTSTHQHINFTSTRQHNAMHQHINSRENVLSILPRHLKHSTNCSNDRNHKRSETNRPERSRRRSTCMSRINNMTKIGVLVLTLPFGCCTTITNIAVVVSTSHT
jgi:cation transport ATPase